MKKKLLSIVIITLFIITSLSVGSTRMLSMDTSLNPIVLDQSQEEQTGSIIIPWLEDYQEWQTFTPSMSNIVKIELLIVSTLYEAYDLVVKVKQSDITIYESRIPVEDLPHDSQQWVEFWTPNQVPISISPGSLYIIEVTVPLGSRILWAFSANNPYPGGRASADSSFDCCFRTYAVEEDNNPPDSPSVPDGPIEGVVGEEYIFSTYAYDPDDDSIFYMFDWGDGHFSDWLGPYDSGQLCSAGHSWDSPGVYSIGVIARDIWGDESEWVIALDIRIFDILGRKYALLVAPVRSVHQSNDETEFKHNIHEMRKILLDNGWTDDNIIFLTRDDIAKQAPTEPWIDGDATLINIEAALNAFINGGSFLFQQTDGSWGPSQYFSASRNIDKIFIEFRDHGGQYYESQRPPNQPDPRPGDELDGKDGCFKTYAWDDRSYNKENYFWDDELDIFLDQMDYEWLVLQIDTCHSAEYIPDCSDPNRIIITSCKSSENSCRYAYLFYEGILNPAADGITGGPIDGRISIEEAHHYCKWRMSNEGFTQTPMISDYYWPNLHLGPNVMESSEEKIEKYTSSSVQDLYIDISSQNCDIVINELYYASGDYNDPLQWVELFNKNNKEFDLSGLGLQFGLIDGSNIFPENTTIPGSGYLIVTHDSNAFYENFDVPPNTIVLDDDTMGNNFGAPIKDTLFLLFDDLSIVDYVDYGGGLGRAPNVEPPDCIARFKGGYDTGESNEDWYVEKNPTPGSENNNEKTKTLFSDTLWFEILHRFPILNKILNQII
jgi:hypothetical protein